ncbi:MAG: response regulator [Rhodocyclaceae bacterium]
MPKILIVDDEVGIRELLSEILQDEGYDITLAENAGAARAARNAQRPDLVLLDIWMPDSDGISLLKEWAANGQLTMPVIMMSGHGTIDSAVEATRIGALDFLEKPIALQKLLATVRNGLARKAASSVPSQLTLTAFNRSVPLRDFRQRLLQVRERSRLLLMRIGSGSIAELAARTLQPPGSGWLDLSALPEPVEGEQLQALRGGVVFVPELVRLNRVQRTNLVFVIDRLERYKLTVALATDQGNDGLLKAGWDEALLNRLAEVSLLAPGLGELRDEIPEMATLILQHLAEAAETPPRKLSSAALNALRTRNWPNGYPELRAAIRSLALATLNETIDLEDVERELGPPLESAASPVSLDQPLREAREQFERMYFEYHLAREASNMTRIAERTGVERTHLYRKLRQLGLHGGRRTDEGSTE